MTIIRMFCSSMAVVVTIAACVAGAPVQNQGENIGLNNEVYSQPELAEALARTYQAIEWQRNHNRGAESEDNLSRNLDHIGGGHLLRNLDHIGGGHLLRRVSSGVNEPESNYELVGDEDFFREMNKERYRQSRSAKYSRPNLDPIGGPNIVRREAPNEYERNLDHIGGSNLLRDLEIEEHKEGRPSISSSATLDPLGGPYLVGLVPQSEYDRNLDHIGGANLLRDLEIAPYSETSTYRRRRVPVESNAQSGNRRNQTGKKNLPDTRGTLDSIGGGNFVRRDAPNEYERNLDHIGGSNLLRDVEIKGHREGRSSISSSGTVDPLEAPNLLALVPQSEFDRNLDHIGGGNLLRDLEIVPYTETGPYRNRRSPTERNGQSGNRRNQSGKKNLPDTRGTLDSIGGGNFVRRDINDANNRERNLDHIGGSNLLRQLDPLGGPNFV